MSEQMVTTVIASLISVMALWVFYFWLYGWYRIDVYQQALYLLRDRLFDETVDGPVDFSHPAYGMLRKTIDNVLQYSHQIFLSDVTARLLIHPGKSADLASYRNAWDMSIRDLDDATKARMNACRDEMHKIIGNHVSLSMPFLSLLTLFLANAVPLRLGWFSPVDVGIYMAILQTD